MKALFALIHARNQEFIRDKSALGWALIFPVILICALAFVFDNEQVPMYRIGLLNIEQNQTPLSELPYIQWVQYDEQSQAEYNLARHRIDILLTHTGYALNPDNRQGYFLEQLLLAKKPELTKQHINGRQLSHAEWYLPGILSMNMMFSALYGVGYVLVRYRRTGVLKRLQVTPLSASQFLLAQLISRLLAILTTSSLVFFAISVVFDIQVQGSLALLLLSSLLGTSALISLGLLVASRSRSDEMSNGMMNVLSWPMMFLSGIWFSVEGSPYLEYIAQLIPLTHMNQTNRAIISDGATLFEVAPALGLMTLFTLCCFSLAVKRFRW